MKKAIRLLSICAVFALLAAASAFCAAAAEEPPAVDVPADQPAGTVYSVGTGDALLPDGDADPSDTAATVVDLSFDGEEECAIRFSGESRYYYGAQISGVKYGAVIDGAVTGYFGSSNGAIPLYDGRGAVSGIVWGDGRSTAVDCGVGLLLAGNVKRGITVEDGASFHCADEVVLCQSGSGSFRFFNAKLTSDAGVLLRMEPDALRAAVSYGNGAYTGEHINSSAGTLSVTVGHGALLCGDTVQDGGPIDVTVAAGGIWVIEQSAEVTCLTVEDGGSVYANVSENEDGSITLLPADNILEPGTYEASPITEALPFGTGPAVEPDGQSAPEPEKTEPEEGAEPAEDAGSEPDSRLFPLLPDATEGPEPQDTPEPDSAEQDASAEEDVDAPPDTAAQEQQDGISLEFATTAAAPGNGQDLGCALVSGLAFARRSDCQPSPAAVAPSMELAAQLTFRALDRPAAAALVKTGAKTNSFLLEALDNQAIILYNPYCCSAA